MRSRVGLFVFLTSIIAISGCSSSSQKPESHKDAFLTIQSNKHYYDSNGYLLMTREDFKNYVSTGKVTPAPSPKQTKVHKFSPDEFAVLMKDKTAFYSELDGQSPEKGEVSVLIKKGTLEENLKRITKELGYDSVQWEVKDSDRLIFQKPTAITGIHRRAVIINAIKDFPVKAFFEEDKSHITFSSF